MTVQSAGTVSAPVGAPVADLAALVRGSRRLVVLTGAGCSTESGIPDYRDENGDWKHKRPVQFQDFVGSEAMRRHRPERRSGAPPRSGGVRPSAGRNPVAGPMSGRRRSHPQLPLGPLLRASTGYWARSLVGWNRIAGAEPNAAHRALAELEQRGQIHGLITQNVDGLHHKAGSRKVIDLHGRLDVVECLDCRATRSRVDFQTELDRLNPGWRRLRATVAPDGDAALDGVDFDAFEVPACHCGGILKPGVVFFGEAVPRERTAAALAWLNEADALLVVGSSLMVWSGFRFARRAAERGIPIAAINLGRTRADDKITLRLNNPCGAVLAELVSLVPPLPRERS
ncbi:MAG TPA: NAD-dependent protein deacetylase [Gammaproteobacteria bacterium]|nr:NAD-dependent protein deacetylase [Gammaproteobacteria bacterium]